MEFINFLCFALHAIGVDDHVSRNAKEPRAEWSCFLHFVTADFLPCLHENVGSEILCNTCGNAESDVTVDRSNEDIVKVTKSGVISELRLCDEFCKSLHICLLLRFFFRHVG